MPIFHRDSTASPSSGRSNEKAGQQRYSHRLSRREPSPISKSSKTSASSSGAHSHGLFHRHAEDVSIQAARDQVFRAETAEREADKALVASRKAVKEAREHVKRLEREAAEE